jgi:methionyl-tRNA formyltransferase
MEKQDLRIVYMGTPEFAVAPLQSLLNAGYNIVAVVTMPDKPAGRGMKLQASPVKQFALEHNIPVMQPERLKDETFLAELRAVAADLQIVVAFRMLPEAVWRMPRLGTFNLHASLLPQYRGAAPINWAVINGETETGVTTFFLQHAIDTGEIIFQQHTPIGPDDNAGTVHDRLMLLGAELVVRTVDAIVAGNVHPVPQASDDITLRPAPKIFREMCQIDWLRPASQVHNFIRGLAPYPAAWAELSIGGTPLTVKIFDTRIIRKSHRLAPGTVCTDGRSLQVAATDGLIDILSLQLPGRKRLSIDEVLRGLHL